MPERVYFDRESAKRVSDVVRQTEARPVFNTPVGEYSDLPPQPVEAWAQLLGSSTSASTATLTSGWWLGQCWNHVASDTPAWNQPSDDTVWLAPLNGETLVANTYYRAICAGRVSDSPGTDTMVFDVIAQPVPLWGQVTGAINSDTTSIACGWYPGLAFTGGENWPGPGPFETPLTEIDPGGEIWLRFPTPYNIIAYMPPDGDIALRGVAYSITPTGFSFGTDAGGQIVMGNDTLNPPVGDVTPTYNAQYYQPVFTVVTALGAGTDTSSVAAIGNELWIGSGLALAYYPDPYRANGNIPVLSVPASPPPTITVNGHSDSSFTIAAGTGITVTTSGSTITIKTSGS